MLAASANCDVVRAFWNHIRKREWDRATDLLTEDFVAEWPHARECIRGGKRFVDFVENYPGDWEVEIRRVVAGEDHAAAELIVDDHEGTFYVAWLYELRDRRIAKATEYWMATTDEPIPDWRSPWVERY
jgi:ketosteroid isomerase-like protein